MAISAKASPDYIRQRLPDGRFRPEGVAFGKGGIWGGAVSDETLEKMTFMDVARVIAGPMAAQSYLSSHDPKSTRLLIMVYWGATRAPEHAMESAESENLQEFTSVAMSANHVQAAHFNPNDSCAPTQIASSAAGSYAIRSPAQIDLDNAMTGAMAAESAEDRAREQLDAENAAMLGYDAAWDEAVAYKATPLEFRRSDLVDELEEGRYFVVLMAYDFQLMWKEKKAKLLWETRYSISQRGNDFSKELAAMSLDASKYFGRDSGGLIHNDIPVGRVEIGGAKVVAYGAGH
ncbi:MAG TPA: hypothetical protein VGG34_01900 [Opitutaceae bacterium]